MDKLDEILAAFAEAKLPASELVKKIKNNDSIYEELKTLTSDLPVLDIPKFDISRRLYHMLNHIPIVPICDNCGNPRLFDTLGKGYCHTCGTKLCFNKYRAENIKKTCLEKYGVDNPRKVRSVIDKAEKTNLERYGNTCPLQSEEGINKKKDTWMKKYGVDHPLKNDKIMDKLRKTNIERYGFGCSFQNKDVQEKFKKNFINKYGVDNPTKLKDVRDKVKMTCLEKYGVENPMQDAKIFSLCGKNMRKYKSFIFPSGKQIKIRGYEGLAISNLLVDFVEEDLVTDNKEIEAYTDKIFYFTKDGKKHRYFPDIYIKSKNKIIEVKSVWTYELHPEINNLKKKACLDLNILFEFMILTKSGEYIEYKNK